MTNRTHRAERRTSALSRERIVEAAIEILDAEGERGLTFRALSARLATGSGAIYWHVANKDELLATATDGVIGRVMASATGDAPPLEAIRAIAVGLFDAIDAHPWIGAELAREPRQSSMVRIYEGIGGRLMAFGLADQDLFNAASSLVSYILGAASVNAANARMNVGGRERTAILGEIVAFWTQFDPVNFPFAHWAATRLAEHDDREQFLAGIDLILAGIQSLR